MCWCVWRDEFTKIVRSRTGNTFVHGEMKAFFLMHVIVKALQCSDTDSNHISPICASFIKGYAGGFESSVNILLGKQSP